MLFVMLLLLVIGNGIGNGTSNGTDCNYVTKTTFGHYTANKFWNEIAMMMIMILVGTYTAICTAMGAVIGNDSGNGNSSGYVYVIIISTKSVGYEVLKNIFKMYYYLNFTASNYMYDPTHLNKLLLS